VPDRHRGLASGVPGTGLVARLPPNAEDEWLRHRNQPPTEWPFLGFRGLRAVGFLHGVNSALERSMGRRSGDLGGANPFAHPLSSAQRHGTAEAGHRGPHDTEKGTT
jgi:hypothetical protein